MDVMHYGQANTLTLRREEYNTAMLRKFNVNLMLYAEIPQASIGNRTTVNPQNDVLLKFFLINVDVVLASE